MAHKHTVIVGSGVAALAVARRLLERDPSVHVTLLEAGDIFKVRDMRHWLDFVTTGKSPTKKYEDKSGDVEIDTDCSFSVIGGRMMALGGSTNHWGGWCIRMKPEDFRLGDVRKGSINWQLSYEDIAHYYTEAEYLLNVCGDSANSTVPRFNQSFPHKPVPFTALDHLLIPTLKSLGLGYEALPIARNPNVCLTTGTCRYCPLGARYTGAGDLEALQATYGDRLDVQVRSPVLAIRMRDRKTATGVTYLDSVSGHTKDIEADRVIIAAGTIESAKLLLASTSTFWPMGIGNDTGHVGRHIVAHPLLRAFGRIGSNPHRLEQEIDFPTLMCRHFDSEEYQTKGKMFFIRDGKYIRIDIAAALLGDKNSAGKTPAQINNDIISGTRIELRAFVEPFPDDSNRVSLANSATSLGLPKTKISYREAPETMEACKLHQRHLQEFLIKVGLKDTPQLNAGKAESGSFDEHLPHVPKPG